MLIIVRRTYDKPDVGLFYSRNEFNHAVTMRWSAGLRLEYLIPI